MLSAASFGLISLDFDSAEETITAAAARGLGWAEFYIGPDVSEQDAERLAGALAEHEVRPASISSMARLAQAEEDAEQHLAWVRSSIRVAAALGAPFATFMYGTHPVLNRRQTDERFLGRLEPLIVEAEASDVTLLIENVFSRRHSGDLDDADATLALLERIGSPRVGLNFDPGNFSIGGEEAYPYAYGRLAPFIRYMHLKDVARYTPARDGALEGRRLLDDHARPACIAVPPGAGVLNTNGLLQALQRDGFEGPIALEPTAKGALRESWLTESIAWLRRNGVAFGSDEEGAERKEGVGAGTRGAHDE